MQIKDKLRLLDKSAPPPLQPRASESDLEALAEMLGGKVIENEYGAFLRFQHRIPISRCYGQIELSSLSELSGDTLRIIARQRISDRFDIRKALFIDTETTGLAGGTGTYVFLVGAGYIQDDFFVVEQLFLPRLAAERALLAYLSTLVDGCSGLVSFNGKSFDIPLLATRYIANRFDIDLQLYEHLDLLHAARRIWKRDFGDCCLATLESALFGFARHEDVPGEEIPYIYLEFLRYGRTERLSPVLSHNRLDIISLAALVVVLAESVSAPKLPARQTGRVARLHAEAQSLHKAAELYGQLNTQAGLSPAEKVDTLLELARVLKKLGRHSQAVALWNEATAFGYQALEAFVELAKYFEHREKAPEKALALTERALRLIEDKLALSVLNESRRAWDQHATLRHRAARLRRKLQRTATP